MYFVNYKRFLQEQEAYETKQLKIADGMEKSSSLVRRIQSAASHPSSRNGQSSYTRMYTKLKVSWTAMMEGQFKSSEMGFDNDSWFQRVNAVFIEPMKIADRGKGFQPFLDAWLYLREKPKFCSYCQRRAEEEAEEATASKTKGQWPVHLYG